MLYYISIIASGAALGGRLGVGVYKLFLNQGEISVSVSKPETSTFTAMLKSPATWFETALQEYVKKILNEFNLSIDNLDVNYPVSFAFAGAKLLIIVLKDRKKLAGISYHLERLKTLMQEEELLTINMLWGRVQPIISL